MANVGLPQSPQNQPSENPIMGLFLDRPAHTIDPKGFQACNNVRIELGRVRSDLMGWAVPDPSVSPVHNLPGTPIYLDTIATSGIGNFLVAVNGTDVCSLAIASPLQLFTPQYNAGTISVNNGSASVTGTTTFFNSDITGNINLNTTGTISPGATTLTVTQTGTGINKNVLIGMPIADTTSPGSLLNGTYITTVTGGSGVLTLGLSSPVQLSLPATDTLFVGAGSLVRKNVRPGDFICFNVAGGYNLSNTWYEVSAVGSDTSLTLSIPYVGTNVTNGTYFIRQCLTPPTLSGTSFKGCSADQLQYCGGFTGVPSGTETTNNDCWFFTNGTDPVVVWYSNLQRCSYSRSIPFRTCAAIKQFRGIVAYGALTYNFAGTINQLGTSMASSDNNLPQQMNSGIAFQGIVTSGALQIGRMAILGTTLLIYCVGSWIGSPLSSDSLGGAVTSGSLVGFPTIWTFNDVVQTRGPVAGNAVAVFPDRHQFLTIDGEFRYNGLFIQVMNDHIWRDVMKQFDFTRANECFTIDIPTYGDLIWAVPLISDPANQLFPVTAFVEHYMEQANSYLFKPFTQRDFPFTALTSWVVPGSREPPAYLASDYSSGLVWQLYTTNVQGQGAGGLPALSTVTWGSRPIGNGRARQLVTRVYPEIEYISGGGSISVTLTLQDAAAGPVTITDTQTFNPNYAGNRFTNHFRRGRQASVTISDTAGLGWICDGYDWDYTLGGVR